ncbi:MAG: hypothetical protein OXB86_04195 [Bdellovibrionales bacterium]|nr:hypothetical protein [Bdellovibrionales bacterium]
MKSFCVIFIGLCMGLFVTKGWSSFPPETKYMEEDTLPTEFEERQRNNPDAAFEEEECDSCFMEAQQQFPPFFPSPHPPFPHPPFFPSPHPPPIHPVCGYGASNFCMTMNGHMCLSFIINYPMMTNWLSSCIQVWPFFRSCMQLSGPGTNVPVISSGCYPRGTPCLCNFVGYYEAGNIL